MAKKLIPPTRAEDRTINRGIAHDPETFEATAQDFARAKRAWDVLPASIYNAGVHGHRRPAKGSQDPAG